MFESSFIFESIETRVIKKFKRTSLHKYFHISKTAVGNYRYVTSSMITNSHFTLFSHQQNVLCYICNDINDISKRRVTGVSFYWRPYCTAIIGNVTQLCNNVTLPHNLGSAVVKFKAGPFLFLELQFYASSIKTASGSLLIIKIPCHQYSYPHYK